jgi:hypothetical protein
MEGKAGAVILAEKTASAEGREVEKVCKEL